MKPIKPSEVSGKKSAFIPDFVIESVNEMIVKRWVGNQSVFVQSDLINEILKKKDGLTKEKIFEDHMLDFEGLFRKEGWIVEYDKPGYNEDYEPVFIFRQNL